MKKILYITLWLMLGCAVQRDNSAVTVSEVYVDDSIDSLDSTYHAINRILEAAGISVAWESANSDFATKAVQEDKWAILWFHAQGCPYCEQMERDTFYNINIINMINESFIPVKLDIEEHPDKFYYFAIRPFADEMSILPTTVFISPQGNSVAIRGHISINKFSFILNQIVNNGFPDIINQR